MKKLFLVMALAASPASAAGIDLTWTDCVGTGHEVSSLCFRCSGPFDENYDMVLQFEVGTAIPNFVGLAAYVDYQNDTGAPLSPFRRYEIGGCNNPAVGTKGIAMFDNIQLLPNCAAAFADPWDGDGTGGYEGIAAYGVDFRRPGNGYLILGDSRKTPVRIEPNLNYYAFHLTFNNRNRSVCAGCTDEGTFIFQRAELESNDGSPRVDLYYPNKLTQYASINQPNCMLPVPARPMSWGRIKSLYR